MLQSLSRQAISGGRDRLRIAIFITLLAARLLLKLSNVYATSRGEKKSLTEVLKQIRKIMERPELDIL
jgi:hypothetical protein